MAGVFDGFIEEYEAAVPKVNAALVGLQAERIAELEAALLEAQSAATTNMHEVDRYDLRVVPRARREGRAEGWQAAVDWFAGLGGKERVAIATLLAAEEANPYEAHL